MPFISRKTSLSRLRERIRKNQPIVGAGAGTGISAKFAERGGVDLIIIYNSGRYRMAGRGSLAGLLPYGDANAIVQDMAKEVLPVVRDTPVLAGVCGTDPFRIIPVLLRELQAMGFDGIQNFPTVGLIDGVFRQNLEETGMSYDLEVEMVREARRLAAQLNRSTAPVTLVLPLGGVSMIDAPGQPFHDPEADRALFETLRESVGPTVRVVDVDAHINDPLFADTLVREMLAVLTPARRTRNA